MEKTYILGTDNISITIKGREIKKVLVSDLDINDVKGINLFIERNFSDVEDSDVIVFSVDKDNLHLLLTIALHIRLSLQVLKSGSLAPFLFTSQLPLELFLKAGRGSQIFLSSAGWYFCEPEDVNYVLGDLKGLTVNNYKSEFLDKISIEPDEVTGGNHSIANQWGASVLARVINLPADEISAIDQASRTLYFKYIYAQTLDNIKDAIDGKNVSFFNIDKTYTTAYGKHILLIDDEADKGWDIVLKKIIRTEPENFQVLQQSLSDYKELPTDIRKHIKNGFYDLIFLDLRLNGKKEDKIYDTNNISGMKILKEIKQANPGTQVIIFTASNKAWNLKALLEEKADGYYIKESPEYKFSFTFSKENFSNLLGTTTKCLNKGYLKEVWKKMASLSDDFDSCQDYQKLRHQIIDQLNISYILLTQNQFSYAYVSLNQVLEYIILELLDCKNGTWYIKETKEQTNNWIIDGSNQCQETTFSYNDLKKNYPEWKKIASLYYQLFEQEDKSYGYYIREAISDRGEFMHSKASSNSQVYTAEGYMKLFKLVIELCELI
jgi:CheY-like chemotaxis protein